MRSEAHPSDDVEGSLCTLAVSGAGTGDEPYLEGFGAGEARITIPRGFSPIERRIRAGSL
jgi:hypothetical protein